MKDKTNLTTKERITCAHFYYNKGMTQQMLADLFRVNHGRVNEACLAIRQAATDPKKILKYRKTDRLLKKSQ